ncbi:phenylacetate--CoA ligase family protein [Prosthecobacter vanneervenii]|uniref:Phenylacetate-coenzyme A ligase PaaK-like adenylate-forming protein n=1 Tax=Prosthecobacter vanneervenii TaxID=48466 RepID=A0A7W7Y894_9BACT|nr:AMP-binding protein [Prosthecobacter vanneervenii]MBB5031421.1 phenylacetate-coenzyme A ligase PaaK-like adenylate-forming protein [Prosthecobacter vanneervenii]
MATNATTSAPFASFFQLIQRTLWALRQFAPSRQAPEAIQRTQQERLRALLAQARAGSAFYREKFRHLPEDCTDLQAFPITTKAEMMAHFDAVVTDPAVTRAGVEGFMSDAANAGRLFLGKYAVAHTSGSQGQPALIVQNQQVLDLLYAFQLTRGQAAGAGSAVGRLVQTVRRLLRPTRVAVLSSAQGFFPSACVWQHLPRYLHWCMRFLFVPANDPRLLDKLNEFSPSVLTAMPSTLELLALNDEELHLPRLERLITCSEPLTAKTRERLRHAFGVPVLDNYACGECLFLSNGCPTAPGAHLNSDWAILEVVDAHNQPVPPGQPGHKVLLTNLANTVQPFIRYELGDGVTMATEPCGCGSRLPRLQTIRGRTEDVFWLHIAQGYRALLEYPFQHAFDPLREVREWQAVQVERNHLIIRLESIPGTVVDVEAARRRLEERLRTTGWPLAELHLTLEAVPNLTPDEPTTKFRHMVSHTGPPADLDTEHMDLQAESTGSPCAGE